LGVGTRGGPVVSEGVLVERVARRFAVCCASRKTICLSSCGVVPADMPDALFAALLEEESSGSVTFVALYVPSRKNVFKSSSEIRGVRPNLVAFSLPDAMKRFTVRTLIPTWLATSSGQ
jgi:hypothetical protein